MADNTTHRIKLSDHQMNCDTVKKNATLTHLVATNYGTYFRARSFELTHNVLPTDKPNMGQPRLLVCSANIESYFIDSAYAGAKGDKQKFALQTLKIAKGLTHIDADIYALCELQQGTRAASTLVAKMNELCGEQRYTYLMPDAKERTVVSCGFIYRKDKVSPYGMMSYAYPSGTFHYRMVAQSFVEKSTKERFAISLSHTISKASGDDNERYANVQKIHQHIQNVIKGDWIFGSDPDVLIVGDYNCYTQERPIQYMVQQGYVDQLMRFDSLGYSYNYDGQVGYLDHCFSTVSMNSQITAVHPYHINTDYAPAHEYKYLNDDSFCRYADHDPILIGLNLTPSTDLSTIVTAPSKCSKVVVKGQLRIIKNGVTYTIQGQPIYDSCR